MDPFQGFLFVIFWAGEDISRSVEIQSGVARNTFLVVGPHQGKKFGKIKYDDLLWNSVV